MNVTISTVHYDRIFLLILQIIILLSANMLSDAKLMTIHTVVPSSNIN